LAAAEGLAVMVLQVLVEDIFPVQVLLDQMVRTVLLVVQMVIILSVQTAARVQMVALED